MPIHDSMGGHASALVRPDASPELHRGPGRSRPIAPVIVAPILAVAATVGWAVDHGMDGLATAALRHALVYGVGVGAFIAALGHLIDGDATARAMRRTPGSAFQIELGAAYLGLGALGLACAWQEGGVWWATIAMAGALGIGRVLAHVRGAADRHAVA